MDYQSNFLSKNVYFYWHNYLPKKPPSPYDHFSINVAVYVLFHPSLDEEKRVIVNPRPNLGPCERLDANGHIRIDNRCLAGQSKRRIVNPPPRQPSGPCEVLDSNGDIVVDNQCMMKLAGQSKRVIANPRLNLSPSDISELIIAWLVNVESSLQAHATHQQLQNKNKNKESRYWAVRCLCPHLFVSRNSKVFGKLNVSHVVPDHLYSFMIAFQIKLERFSGLAVLAFLMNLLSGTVLH